MDIQPHHSIAPNASFPKPPVLHAAKWPPDDDDVPGAPAGAQLPGSPGGMGGMGGGEDGNFKRGAIKPIAVIVALLLVAGGAIAIIMSIKTESERVPVEQLAKEMKGLALLPMPEQLPKWRELAKSDDRHAVQEAYAHLAFARDQQGLPIVISGLASPDHTIRGTAAQALVEYGSPAADGAKPALEKALAESDNSDKPQICLALIAVHDSTAFDAVLAEYKLGHLQSATRLDGFPAFDAEEMARMVSVDKIASLVGDDNPSVRQLVATTLARTGDAKWLPQLTTLVGDSSVEIAREAAVGLGKIANEASMIPLLGALTKADKESRQKFLEALRDGVGGKGLVLALRSVNHTKPETEKFQMKQLFDMMRDLADPRIGDSLSEWVATTNPSPHWKTEAGIRMAEVGDLRAAPILGWRLAQDPMKLYNDVEWPELRRDDNERVFSARMLADLAMIHPEGHDQLRKAAEDGAMFWAKSRPQPHANALRFLVAAESQVVVPPLKAWADPSDKLPDVGEVGNFPMNWATAHSALRYLGWSKNGWDILTKQINRRPVKIDASWDALKQGGLTVLGMTLSGIGSGAADGFAQWGDPKAVPILTKHIESAMENEDSRTEACFALAWVATDDDMKAIVQKVHDNDKPDVKSAFLRSCYLETLIRHPVPAATAGLMDLLKPDLDIAIRHQVARAIGMGGVTQAMLPVLFEKMKDKSTRTDAALAILLGGDNDWSMRTVAFYDQDPDDAILGELKEAYNATFYYSSDRNFESGDIARWVSNADAVAHTRVKGAFQDWAREILSRNIVDSTEFDNGPHSYTRVVLRARLLADAKGANEVKRNNAIDVLKFMKEKGVLMALRNETGPVGELARKAFFEVMNPKAITDKLPEELKAQGGGGGAGSVRAVPH
jgi:HEAT repeat protein